MAQVYGTNWPNGWSWRFSFLSIVSSSADYDVDFVSCNYWLITTRINLPKICLLGLGLSGVLLLCMVNFSLYEVRGL